jgi:uncharacterized membrane protein YfcA
MITLFAISLIFLIAGFIQGFSGFGSALFAMPLLSFLIDTRTAVPLCVLNSLIIATYLFIELKNHMEREMILPLIIGSLPGILIGIIFLKNAESESIQILLGLLIIAYGIYSLMTRGGQGSIHPLWGYIAGFFTGFIGSAFSAGGPPAVIYTSLTGWTKNQVKATLTGFFFFSSIITVSLHAVSGFTTHRVITYFFASALFVLIGTHTGSRFYSTMSRQRYIRSLLILLIILGIMMSLSASY